MIWRPADAHAGDVIRVDLGGFCHYGIFVSEDEVIQFGLPPVKENRNKENALIVTKTDIDTFACGRIVEVAFPDKKERVFSPDEIVSRARARLGEGGYNLIHNNCEHFATECAFGVRRCAQEEDARRRWRERPLLEVFLSPVGTDENDVSLPPARQDEIALCGSADVRREKTADWRLLTFGLKKTLGLDAAALAFEKSKNGKWSCEGAYFSLTHAGGWAAAAISNKPVGVDLEFTAHFSEKLARQGKPLEKLMRHAATKREKQSGPWTKDTFLEAWTRKEAVFKRDGANAFHPDRIESDDPQTVTFLLENPCGAVLSVSGAHANAVRLYLCQNGTAALLPLPKKKV